MRRDELHKNVREKFFFEGKTSVGKTFLSLTISKIYAMNGKKVLFIDPEDGVQRELDAGIFDSLTDRELENIEMIHANDIDDYLKWINGWEEDKSIGPQKSIVQYGTNYDLKVCDGLTAELEQYKFNLIQKFIKQKYYTIGDKQFPINNPDLFNLPYQIYSKLYDQLRDAITVMMKHKYDIICTAHPFKDTEAVKMLEQSIYGKFDSVIRLDKMLLPSGTPKWNAIIVKNRGKESPDKSNKLDDIQPIIIYFIKKFNMNIDETLEKLGMLEKVEEKEKQPEIPHKK